MGDAGHCVCCLHPNAIFVAAHSARPSLRTSRLVVLSPGGLGGLFSFEVALPRFIPWASTISDSQARRGGRQHSTIRYNAELGCLTAGRIPNPELVTRRNHEEVSRTLR